MNENKDQVSVPNYGTENFSHFLSDGIKELKKMKTHKKVYFILSGEIGCDGTYDRVFCTSLGIKRRLTKERCGGDRWARAYCYVDLDPYGLPYGYDVESGVYRTIPRCVF